MTEYRDGVGRLFLLARDWVCYDFTDQPEQTMAAREDEIAADDARSNMRPNRTNLGRTG